jgi:oligopeptide transport system ATP-binding protein
VNKGRRQKAEGKSKNEERKPKNENRFPTSPTFLASPRVHRVSPSPSPSPSPRVLFPPPSLCLYSTSKTCKPASSLANGVVHAVNDVSFQVNDQETIGIVGESGSGKSMTMLSVMRLIPQPPGKITGGEVIFEGRDLLQLSLPEIRKIRGNRIAMIFQDPMTSLNPVLTVEKQFTEAIRIHLNLGKTAARDRAIELLEHVGIPGVSDRIRNYPHQFSGGMRQRVMIAMGLACNPKLLIADEPTTALDVTIQAQIVELVKRLKAGTQHGGDLDYPRPVAAGQSGRSHSGNVCRTNCGICATDQLYSNPRHPYTLGLLQSIPRLDEAQKADPQTRRWHAPRPHGLSPGLPLCSPLPLRRRSLPHRRPHPRSGGRSPHRRLLGQTRWCRSSGQSTSDRSLTLPISPSLPIPMSPRPHDLPSP